MAANFRILIHHSSESLHLKLLGDFDGTSAYEVINTMLENAHAHRIIIHTAGVNEVHPFGKAVFENNFPFKNHEIEVIFTGEHAAEIAPDFVLTSTEEALKDTGPPTQERDCALRESTSDYSHS
jgi:hypothetical protein